MARDFTEVSDADLHELAREIASEMRSTNRRQLRFNEIVSTARLFYTTSPAEGVKELVESCDRQDRAPPDFIGPMPANPAYDEQPMWRVLREQYRWMIGDWKQWLA